MRGADSRCRTCRHSQRIEVDAALIEGIPERRLAAQFSLSPSSVHRHRAHVTALMGANAAETMAAGPTLMQRILRVVSGLESLSEDALDQRNAGAYLFAARELRPYLELLGRATGELTRRDSVQAFVERELGSSIAEAKRALESARRVRDMDDDSIERSAVDLIQHCARQRGLTLEQFIATRSGVGTEY